MVYWTLSSFCYLPLPVYISSRDDEILFKFSGLRDTTTTPPTGLLGRRQGGGAHHHDDDDDITGKIENVEFVRQATCSQV